MLNGFSFRQFLQKKLYAPGTYTDQQYSFSGSTGANYTAYIYNNAESRFRGNCKCALLFVILNACYFPQTSTPRVPLSESSLSQS